jgi:hypothetical protein
LPAPIVSAFAARERPVLGQVKKGNHSATHDDVRLFVTEQKAKDFADTTVSRCETVESDHGRIETPSVAVIHDVDWLVKRHKWPKLNGIVVVDSTVETNGKTVNETRLYITSSLLDAERLGADVRGHWAIEKQPASGDGRVVRGRRVPRPRRPGSGQFRDDQARGAEPVVPVDRQGLNRHEATRRVVGQSLSGTTC